MIPRSISSIWIIQPELHCCSSLSLQTLNVLDLQESRHKKNSNKVAKPANKHIHRLSNIWRFLRQSSCILHGFRNTEDCIKFQPPSCCFSVSLDLNQTLQHTTYCLSERFPARAICKLKLCITTLLQDGKEIKRLATNHHLLEQSHVGQSLPLGLGILSNRPWEH